MTAMARAEIAARGRRVILVTGLPRSGTTAVGGYLSLTPGAAALHEPMNGQTGLTNVTRHFELPGTGGFSDADFDAILAGIRTLRLRYRKTGYDRDPLWRKIAARLIGSRPNITYLAARMRSGVQTIVWKDPLAFFCLDRAAAAGVPVVVTFRNPFATAASIKRMRWGGRYNEIAGRLNQIGRWPDTPLPRPATDPAYSPVESSALIWNAAYSFALDAAERYPNILFLDMDAVIADPQTCYRSLFARLELPWTEAVETAIRADYIRSDNKDTAGQAAPKQLKAHDKKRDISAANSYWTSILSEEEAALVMRYTSETQARLAARSEWREPV
jgi:hypothetical protein